MRELRQRRRQGAPSSPEQERPGEDHRGERTDLSGPSQQRCPEGPAVLQWDRVEAEAYRCVFGEEKEERE